MRQRRCYSTCSTSFIAGLVRVFLFWLIIGEALMIAGACVLHDHGRHQAVIGSTLLYESLAAIQDTEQTLFEAQQLSADQHRAFNARLVPVLQTGRDVNAVIVAWPTNQPAPVELLTLVTQIRALTEDLVTLLPEGAAKSLLAGKVLAAHGVILGILALFAGGGV